MLLTTITLPRASLPPVPWPILPRPATPAPITLPPPQFTVPLVGTRPDGTVALPKPQQGLDLSIKKEERPTVEQLFPTPAERQRRMMQELSRQNDIANEKDPAIGDSDCAATIPASRDLIAPSGAGVGFDHIPEPACTAHLTLKALKQRNDLYSPH